LVVLLGERVRDWRAGRREVVVVVVVGVAARERGLAWFYAVVCGEARNRLSMLTTPEEPPRRHAEAHGGDGDGINVWVIC
jgi:hypothetical protein